MRKITYLILTVTCVVLLASCGGRRDSCPSVGKVISKERTFIA